MVSSVMADATEVPMPKHKSSSTNGLYALQGVKVHPYFENKKNFGKNVFQPPLRPQKCVESIGEIRF